MSPVDTSRRTATPRRPATGGKWWSLAALALTHALGCAPNAPPAPAVPRPGTTAAEAESGRGKPDALAATIADLLRPYRANGGVAYRVLETGDEYQWQGSEAFPMASTYKFPMALTWLHQVDQGRASLDQSFEVQPEDLVVYHSPLAEESPRGGSYSLEDLLHRMMEQSDNTACDVLLTRLGGPPQVQQNLARLGISGMRVDRSERSMAIDLLEAARPGSVTARDRAFLTALDESLSVEERASYAESYQSDPRDRATPVAMVQLLAKFQRGAALSPGSTKLLRDMMTAAQSRIGAKLLNPVEVANKTGTGMGTFNDIGIVTLPDGRHLALAIYTARARNISWDAGNALVADIAKAVVDALP